MVPHSRRQYHPTQRHVRLGRSVRHSRRYDRILPHVRYRRHPHHVTLHRWILCRSTRLGSSVGNVWSATNLHNVIRCLRGLSSGVCSVEKHRFDIGVPVSGRLLLRCPNNQFGWYDRRYMGCRLSRSGDEHLRFGPICWSIDWSDRLGFH